MNDESLQRANAFLAAASERVAVGEVLTDTPAEIGRALGMPDALSTARAVRALIARRRLEPPDVDPEPAVDAERAVQHAAEDEGHHEPGQGIRDDQR